MIYGLIISAGNQTRFGMKTPKSLMKVGDKCLLDINMEAMRKHCDKVYVVCSVTNQLYFNGYDKIVVPSGLGSGDAIYRALNVLEIKDDDTCFIQWGDSLQLNMNIYSELMNNYTGTVLIPCIFEKRPYVKLEQMGDGRVKVNFTKYGDYTDNGYHDLSLFYGNAKNLLYHMGIFKLKFFSDQDSIYKHRHNEFEFLDLFNDTEIKATILKLNSEAYKSWSFNTLEDLDKMLKELKYV